MRGGGWGADKWLLHEAGWGAVEGTQLGQGSGRGNARRCVTTASRRRADVSDLLIGCSDEAWAWKARVAASLKRRLAHGRRRPGTGPGPDGAAHGSVPRSQKWLVLQIHW